MKLGDRLKFAQAEVDRSKKWLNDANMPEDWRRFSDLYRGRMYDALSRSDRAVVNLVFSTMNTMAPAVSISNPRFVVNARRPESAEQAVVTEEVLNYLWRKHDFQREFRLGVIDWLFCGFAWYKVGYKFVKPPESKRAPDAPTNSNQVADEGSDEGVDDRDPDAEGGDTETEMHIEEDRPFLERISIHDMFVDPDARHPKEMRWIAQRTWRPVADVHVDGRYSATQRARVTGSRKGRFDDDGKNSSVADQPDQGAVRYAEIIEFYDLKRGTVGTFAADTSSGGVDGEKAAGWLIKPKPIPYAHGHPYVMMRNHEVPDEFYPCGDIEQIETLQAELNETRSQMLNYRKRYRRGYLYAQDRFDKDGIKALESDDDNVLIPVMGDTDPDGAIRPLPTGVVPPDFFDQSAMISDDLSEVSGVSEYARGNPQQYLRRTATEAAMIQDASNARAADRLESVESTLAELGARVVALMQQYLTGEQVARIVTIPVKGWVKYDREYISGEFDFEVRGGSTEPQNEGFRRQKAMQLVDVAVPFIQMGVADPAAVWMKVLRDGFGEKDAERYLLDQPPPGEVPPEGDQQQPPMDQQQPPMDPSMQPPMDPSMQPPMDPSMQPPPPQGGGLEALAQMLAADRGVPPQVVPAGQFSVMPPELEGLPPDMLQGLDPEVLQMMQEGIPGDM